MQEGQLFGFVCSLCTNAKNAHIIRWHRFALRTAGSSGTPLSSNATLLARRTLKGRTLNPERHHGTKAHFLSVVALNNVECFFQRPLMRANDPEHLCEGKCSTDPPLHVPLIFSACHNPCGANRVRTCWRGVNLGGSTRVSEGRT